MTAAEDRRALAAEELIKAMDSARELIDAGKITEPDFRRVREAMVAYDEARDALEGEE